MHFAGIPTAAAANPALALPMESLFGMLSVLEDALAACRPCAHE